MPSVLACPPNASAKQNKKRVPILQNLMYDPGYTSLMYDPGYSLEKFFEKVIILSVIWYDWNITTTISWKLKAPYSSKIDFIFVSKKNFIINI